MTYDPVLAPARRWRGRVVGMALMLALSVPSPSYADLGSDLESFFNDLNFSNVTNPGAYQGQAAGYFTGGGLMLRVPQRSYNLYAVQWPKFRAGCGGIDLYTGGFSFINSDELIALLKNIGSTAVSQAFLLALRTLSPQIASSMEQLQSWAQKFNYDNIHACEAGRTLVSGALEHFGREDFACAMTLTDAGTHSWAEARKACQHESARGTTINDSPAGSVGDQVALNGNIAWRALMQNDFFRTDKDLAQVMMNLSGTVVITEDPATRKPLYVTLSS
nr:conjugal transfer protein TraH [Gammaproteobacteria bacterium]